MAKPVSDITMLSDRDYNSMLMLYVGKISMKEIIQEENERFPFTLFQVYIDKEFEVRSFFLDGNFYSIAIFSQNDSQTRIDFRNYNRKKPNRTIPFNLPEDIKKRLLCFLKKAKLRMGSFDLIKSTKGQYYFLEINPVGQFGMVSFPGNFYLEKRLAKYLIYEDQRNLKKSFR